MTTHKSLQRRLLLGSIIVSGCLTLVHAPAYPEAYIAGQFGVTIPQHLARVDVTDAGTVGLLSFKDPIVKDLKDSLMYGAKLGYYSRSVRWFGVETEVFRTTPNIKQTSVTITGPGGSVQETIAGSYLSVITWAVDLMFRYPGHRWQPYLGVGPALFFADRSTAGTGESQSSKTLGLNTQVGLRYFMARNWAIFGEYKFNHTRFIFSESATALDGFHANYSAHIFAFGIGYHF